MLLFGISDVRNNSAHNAPIVIKNAPTHLSIFFKINYLSEKMPFSVFEKGIAIIYQNPAVIFRAFSISALSGAYSIAVS